MEDNREKVEKYLTAIGVNENEQRLIRRTAMHNTLIPYTCIIISVSLYVWIRFYDCFVQGYYFLFYNAVAYTLLVFIPVWAFFYEKRVDRIFKKLIAAGIKSSNSI